MGENFPQSYELLILSGDGSQAQVISQPHSRRFKSSQEVLVSSLPEQLKHKATQSCSQPDLQGRLSSSLGAADGGLEAALSLQGEHMCVSV